MEHGRIGSDAPCFHPFRVDHKHAFRYSIQTATVARKREERVDASGCFPIIPGVAERAGDNVRTLRDHSAPGSLPGPVRLSGTAELSGTLQCRPDPARADRA